MKKWQNEISEKFSETFKDLRRNNKNLDQSIAMVSVDLREKKDSYVLRLSLPDRDVEKVGVTLDNNSLTIDVPAEGKVARYQQILALTGVAADTKPVIERNQKQNLITVTIQKTATAADKATVGQESPASPIERWDRDVLEQMARMHHDMDQMFKQAFEDFPITPEQQGFFDEPRFGSSVVLHDENGNYTVRAYLPGRELKDLKVTVEGQTLQIEAQAEASEEKKANGITSSYKAHYSQMLTLPGPVESDKMKIDRKDEMVVVTLPKAKSSR